MSKKMAFLTAFNVFSSVEETQLFDYIDQYELSDALLSEYDCLVLTGYCDQEFLLIKRPIIENFLNQNKLLIFSGHIVTPWLPGASLFEPKSIESFQDYMLQIPMENAIYKGVDIEDMVFNKGVAGFFARGHHKAPNGSDVYLTIGKNRPVTYVDRVSTNGTILVHSGFNLFGYQNADKTTDYIHPQLIEWCERERKALKNTEVPNRRRIGVIYSGSSQHMRTYKTSEFAKHISRLIPIHNLEHMDLSDLDVLIVPSQTNMNYFLPFKEHIIHFANQGGIVVTFGHQSEEWIPNAVWEYRPTNFWWWLEENADSGLELIGKESDLFVNYLSLADATWHQHGVYWPKNDVETLVATKGGGNVLYIDKQSSKGIWINTTLDPDYHYGSYFMPATEQFLRGFLPWLERGEI